jgi:tetratricopeptide (TPR) repeat protein
LNDYQGAVKREPELAEAHFDLGIVLDRQGKPDAALPEYRTVVQLSPGVARYHHNLADAYFRAEDYDDAIEEYGRMGEFPLAALELAKIYRLQAKLAEARGRDEDAVRWLKDPAVQKAEEQNGWSFEVGPLEEVRLGPLIEKQSYADLELALTRFLVGDDGTTSAVNAAFEKCGSRKTELGKILMWELHKLGSQNAKLTAGSEKFVELFLGG